MGTQHSFSGQANELPLRCLSIDLEVDSRSRKIHAFGAVRSDTGQSISFRSGDLQEGLAKLDDFADGASLLVGHNLIKFDLPHLVAAKPDLNLLKLPLIDTLWLSPLAFPRNPYHRLVKHYKDGALVRERVNNPLLDAEIVLTLLNDEWNSLGRTDKDLLLIWHWLTTVDSQMSGFDMFFSSMRNSSRPLYSETSKMIGQWLRGKACQTHVSDITGVVKPTWPFAYALAWISVAGGNSVMPPWVRYQFPKAGKLLRKLRDTKCADSRCNWCRENHDSRKELYRWFGYSDFREGQKSVVDTAMARKHVLGIMPTGAGKSLCYQVPALSRYYRTGALTVVISPLVALMADQVAGLESKGIGSCVTVNGLLSMTERTAALERVRLGDASILIISPEGLRSTSIVRALDQREISAWVLDEAHCLSRWGHDFRPDYRYVGRFIRNKSENGHVAPIMCLTATAKPEVVDEIESYFRKHLEVELTVFNYGSHRPNLTFQIVLTNETEKFSQIYQIIQANLPDGTSGGAIVYCATRGNTEKMADFLEKKGLESDFFHAGLPPEKKLNVQQSFIKGDLRVLSATNAFGMGIDKEDVRVVIHADIPSSLENYLQEAGRAGRDRKPAHCVLLYTEKDVERQFGLSARLRLTREGVQSIFRFLRRLDKRKRMGGQVVATSGEILLEDESSEFRSDNIRDSATNDTKVRTAISWLEESDMLTREENKIQVFPSFLYVNSLNEAEKKLQEKGVESERLNSLLRIVSEIINADKDQGISTDELMYISGLSPRRVISALYDLENSDIVSNDITLTAFVHSGVQHSSLHRFQQAQNLEASLISYMREIQDDLELEQSFTLSLAAATQALRQSSKDIKNLFPQRLLSILRSISYDGREEVDNSGSLGVRNINGRAVRLTLYRGWSDLEKAAELRRSAAKLMLDHLINRVPKGTRGIDIKVDTTIGKLSREITSDIGLRRQSQDLQKLQNRALMWLHEQGIIRLHKGLTVFRPAMTIHLKKEKHIFTKADFEPLEEYYSGQILQIHIMNEYSRRGLKVISEALEMVDDYFSIEEEEFVERWIRDYFQEKSFESQIRGGGKRKNHFPQTTPESWRRIVEDLKNPDQKRIVEDNREQTNVLVLAGPGSGKTRVLVHRIAYLLRIRRENPRSIIAIAYNRHAAVEIRRRLKDLVGPDSYGVMVLTCHSLAMRLIGFSFSDTASKEIKDNQFFKKVLRDASALLKGQGVAPEESDEHRELLLAGFRWILVDEYQDIGPDEYDLISALAGRTLGEEESKLTLFAVGDDDQNIYSFNGASVEFIRRFEKDYKSRPAFLTDNYRSTHHIIAAANAMISPARNRMKVHNPITVNQMRLKDPHGGEWQNLDPVAQGKVQILNAGSDPVSQAWFAMMELKRLCDLTPNWDWSKCAVIARKWEHLDPVSSFCRIHNVPVQMANEKPPFWHLRETERFRRWLDKRKAEVISGADLDKWLRNQKSNCWNDLLLQAVEEYCLETGGGETTVDHFIEWFAEWSYEIRRRQRGMLLVTAHGSKGLEFDHVSVLGSDWDDSDEERRLYYVAMTRAKKTLSLLRVPKSNKLQNTLFENSSIHSRQLTTEPTEEFKNLRTCFRKLSLEDVFLSFAGYKDTQNPIHRAIAALSPGDPLDVRYARSGRMELIACSSGVVVGQLARAYKPPLGMCCVSANVFAIVNRKREFSDPEYQASMKCDQWEVVLPELVFEPDVRGFSKRQNF